MILEENKKKKNLKLTWCKKNCFNTRNSQKSNLMERNHKQKSLWHLMLRLQIAKHFFSASSLCEKNKKHADPRNGRKICLSVFSGKSRINFPPCHIYSKCHWCAAVWICCHSYLKTEATNAKIGKSSLRKHVESCANRHLKKKTVKDCVFSTFYKLHLRDLRLRFQFWYWILQVCMGVMIKTRPVRDSDTDTSRALPLPSVI